MKIWSRFFILSLVMGYASLGFAQQNAGPLNAAPGAPNQDPAQPSIATKTSTVVNKDNVTKAEGVTEACANLSRNAPCEVKGINSEKVRGRCRPSAGRDSPLVCRIR